MMCKILIPTAMIGSLPCAMSAKPIENQRLPVLFPKQSAIDGPAVT